MQNQELSITEAFEVLLKQRISNGHFDSERGVDEGVIRGLVEQATSAPSAFNLQNWRFIAVCSTEGKARLKGLAYGQQQVEDAAVTYIVVGQLQEYENLNETLQPSVDAGLLPEQVQETFVNMAKGSYSGNLQARRDEAIRSGSLAAMILMLAAQARGMSSGALGGFDPGGVSEAFGIKSSEIPVMLIAVGYPAGKARSQKIRKAVDSVLSFR